MRRFLGLVGSVVLLAGVFLPAWEYNYGPELRSTVTFARTHFLGTVILVLAIVSLVVALLGRCGWLWVSGPASFIVLAVAAAIFWSGATTTSPGNLFWPWDPGVRPTRMLTGVPVLFAGSVLLILTAALRKKK